MARVFEYHIEPAHYIRIIGPVMRIDVQGREGTALLDTGATWSSIDKDLAEGLLLPRGPSRETAGATGRGTYPTFGTDLYIPVLGLTLTGPVPSLPLRDNGHDLDAVIGRDIICRYEFTINAETGLVRFTEL